MASDRDVMGYCLKIYKQLAKVTFMYSIVVDQCGCFGASNASTNVGLNIEAAPI